jgi:hypothetical protein
LIQDTVHTFGTQAVRQIKNRADVLLAIPAIADEDFISLAIGFASHNAFKEYQGVVMSMFQALSGWQS